MEVVIGGKDRDVAQPGRQQRQSGFNVHTGAIPPDQCVYSAAVTKVMNSWQPSGGRVDAGAGEQNAQVLIQAFPGVTAFRSVWTSNQRFGIESGWISRPTGFEESLDFFRDIVGQGQQPRFMKLGSLDQQRLSARIVVPQLEPDELSTAKARSVEKDNGQPRTSPPQRRSSGIFRQYIAMTEESRHFGLGENMRPDDRACFRKLGCIGNETVWHYPPAIDAEISDSLHSSQSGSRRERLQALTPLLKGFQRQIGRRHARTAQKLVQSEENN